MSQGSAGAAPEVGPPSQEPASRVLLDRSQAARRALVALVVLIAAATTYGVATSYPAILDVELGGSRQQWPPAGLSALRAALLWDLLLIAGYGVGLYLLCDLGRRIFWTHRARHVASLAAGGTVLAVAADLLENALLALATGSRQADWLLDAAAGAATLKFCLLAPIGVTAATALGVTALRVVTGRPAALARRRTAVPPPGPPSVPGQEEPSYFVSTIPCPPLDPEPRVPFGSGFPPASEEGRDRTAWAWSVPGLEPAELASRRADSPVVGFCVSGGGIRSASVTLGALQGLRDRLIRARYLTSVSGGGYTAGALQLALQPLPSDAPAGERSTASAADVLRAGSVEEDHLRRHSNYLADGPGEWLTALAVVLRGVLSSLALMTSAVAVFGLLLGFAYATVPLVPGLATLAPHDNAEVPPFPQLGAGVLVALTVLGVAAVLGYVVSLISLSATGTVSGRATSVARTALGLTGLVALLGVGLPALVWASAAVLAIPAGNPLPAAGVGGAGVVLFSYLGALAGMIWRQRKAIGKKLGRFRNVGTGGSKAVAGGLVQRLMVLAVLALLALTYLLVLGSLIATAAAWPGLDAAGGDWQPVWLLVGALLVLAVAGGLVDQTWLGLHPFYRRRLASAFAVRRVSRADGRVVARAYDYDHEHTMLSTHAARLQPSPERPIGFPEVVFVAAANLSGQERTPPGRRAVAFTLTADWVGGPDVGYVATRQLESVVSPHLRRDLTVQAAVAISGAAFASAMGRQARAFQTLFALTHTRLGTWLPNPAFVRRWTCAGSPGHEDEWNSPGLPRLRRISYLLREVFAAFPPDERLLYVTDGGHYENLGLVELLRRRCTEIYCIDSSGDSPPFAGTLAEAITLAREELGVTITLTHPEALVPGGGTPLDPQLPLAAISGRLSQRAVVRGTVAYPAESGLPEEARTGTIFVAKALLTRDLPYELLSYSCKNAVFPHDSTGDQWFDHGQFDAYVALGRSLAAQVELVAPPLEVDLREAAPVTPGQRSDADRQVTSRSPRDRSG